MSTGKPFAETLAEDRRLVVLRSLCEASGNHLNESVLKKALEHIGHRVGRDQVRADAVWLEEHLLVRIEKVDVQSGELWIVHLKGFGEEVAQGRSHPGVARPGLS